jgi:hypothetical protein
MRMEWECCMWEHQHCGECLSMFILILLASASVLTLSWAQRESWWYCFVRSWLPFLCDNKQPIKPSWNIDYWISFNTSQSGSRVLFVLLCLLVDHKTGEASSRSCGDISFHTDQSYRDCLETPPIIRYFGSSSSTSVPLTVSTRLILSLVISHCQSGSSLQ